MPYIGPDSVDLIFRDPAPGVDDNGQPNTVDREVAGVANCSVQIATATEAAGVSENRDNGMVIRYTVRAMLPFDATTTTLTSVCAIRHDGRVYELSADAIPKRTLRGAPDHVRVFASSEVSTMERGELVTITPKFGRDDHGQPLPDGVPVDVVARAVTPGNTTKRLGVSGEQDEADFTVVFGIDDPVKDGDAVTVRGRRGIGRVETYLEQWADRDTKVVTVRVRTGGRR